MKMKNIQTNLFIVYFKPQIDALLFLLQGIVFSTILIQKSPINSIEFSFNHYFRYI